VNRVEVTVGYDDGTTDTVVLRPVTLVAAERHFKGAIPAVEGTLWGVWHQLRKESTFADWLETVADLEELVVPPSSATPSAPSPTSQ